MTKKPPFLSQAEIALWKAFSETITPLRKRKVVQSSPKPLTQQHILQTRQQRQKAIESLEPPLADPRYTDLRLNATRRDRHPKMIDSRLDLHGLTQDQAYQKVKRFIEHQYENQARVLLVITGKGIFRGDDYQKGVLAEALPVWLNQPPLRSYIRTFLQADPQDGGTGAVYIYLKRSRV